MSDQPAPNVDADLVIKGFDKASETILLLSDGLKLFLAHERATVKNPYDDISDDEVMLLCRQPERLPVHLKHFILWQKNMLKLDALEIGKTEMPKGFKFKYDVKGARLAALTSDDARKQCIQIYLDEQEAYFVKFNAVLAILEATEDRFLTIEEVLLRAESLDDRIVSNIQTEKSEIEDIRKKLCDLRAILEDDVLPDVIGFDKAPQEAQAVMLRLSAINVNLRENIRKYHVESDG